MVRNFFYYLGLELFAQIKKNLVSTHSQKPGLSITKDLNKIIQIYKIQLHWIQSSVVISKFIFQQKHPLTKNSIFNGRHNM